MSASPLPRRFISLLPVTTRTGQGLVCIAKFGLRSGMPCLAFPGGRPKWLCRIEDTILAVLRKCTRRPHRYHLRTCRGDIYSSFGLDGLLSSPRIITCCVHLATRARVGHVLTASSQAFYAEALGSPALEYMLVSNATRLAQSKGLHLAYPEASKPQAGEALSRQWLWWVLYAYEKHVAYRSGRPSVSAQLLIFAPFPNPASESKEVRAKCTGHR